MINIINSLEDQQEEATNIRQQTVKKAASSAIEAIKNELPEEAHTVEVMNYVISEMKNLLNQKRVAL